MKNGSKISERTWIDIIYKYQKKYIFMNEFYYQFETILNELP